MASTFTTSFGIEKIGSGEQSGTWGTTTNHNLDLLDRIASYTTVALSGTTHTLTIREASPGSGTENLQDGMYRVIKFTGALGANNTVTIAPNTAKTYFIIENATTDSGSSGPYSVVLTQGSGANVTVQNGKNVIVYCDGAGSGAAVVDALADLQVGTVEVTGAAAIDGAATLGSTLTVTGASQFNSTLTVGVDDTGYDVKFFGDTASRYWLWDTSADGVVQRGTLTVGVDDAGHDVKFFGDTASAYMLWDASTDDLILGGASKMGIGTTSPGAKLEIAGDNQPLIVNSTNSNTFKTVFEDNGTTRGYLGAASGVPFVIGRASDAASQFQFKDLNGYSQLYFAASTTAGGGAGGAYLQALGSNAASPPQIAGIDLSMTDGTDGSESGIIAFHTTNSGTSGERMRIDSGGRLLINKTTLQTVNAPLQVASGLGTGQIFVGNTSGTGWMFGRDNTSTGNFLLGELANDADTSVTGFLTLETGTGLLMIQGSASSYDTTPSQAGLSLYYETDTGAATIGTYSSGGTTRLAFSTNNATAANAERLRIEGAGTIWTPTVSGANNNLRLGYLAGQDLASGGNYNTMVGDSAGTDVNTGDYNTLLGYGAGYVYTTQSNNTMVGNSGVNDTGSNNTGVGHQTIYSAGAGSYLTALGTYALYANTTGDYSVAVGYGALDSNTEGDKNVAVGYNALTANTTASDNTAVGNSAAGSNTTGLGNVAVGHSALYANVLGHYSTVVGVYALDAQAPTGSTSMNNSAFGAYAGTNLTTGLQNTFVGGYSAAAGTVTGHNNTAVGYIAGNDISSGDQNAFFGAYAGYENAGASYNTFLGAYSGYSTDTGTHNTVVGRYAAYSMSSGHNNVIIGQNACSDTNDEELTTAGYCVAIGDDVNVGSATADYQIVIGAGATGKGANTGFISANGSSGSIYQGNDNASWATTSDSRLKKNIKDNNVGLDAIDKIRVRNYEYRKPEEITELDPSLAIEKEGVQLGVVAQEIQKVLPNVVKEEAGGWLSVSNDDVTWHLVNAVKELSAKVKELEEKLNG